MTHSATPADTRLLAHQWRETDRVQRFEIARLGGDWLRLEADNEVVALSTRCHQVIDALYISRHDMDAIVQAWLEWRIERESERRFARRWHGHLATWPSPTTPEEEPDNESAGEHAHAS